MMQRSLASSTAIFRLAQCSLGSDGCFITERTVPIQPMRFRDGLFTVVPVDPLFLRLAYSIHSPKERAELLPRGEVSLRASQEPDCLLRSMRSSWDPDLGPTSL